MKKTLILLALLWIAAVFANESVSIYQLSGAIQCVKGTGTLPEKAADLLRGQGVTIITAEQRKLPQDIVASCGAPTGEANVMEIAAADWSNFMAKNADAGGYGLWVFDENAVRIYKYDGTLQCGMGHEVPLEEMAKELAAVSIEVLASHKGSDGLAHIGVCGASTGAINVYVIDPVSLAAATRLGYRLLVTREMTRKIRPMGTEQRQIGVTAGSLPAATNKSEDTGPIPLLW